MSMSLAVAAWACAMWCLCCCGGPQLFVGPLFWILVATAPKSVALRKSGAQDLAAAAWTMNRMLDTQTVRKRVRFLKLSHMEHNMNHTIRTTLETVQKQFESNLLAKMLRGYRQLVRWGGEASRQPVGARCL